MTWDDLLHILDGIPPSRRNEKAVFVTQGGEEGAVEEAWEIDDLDKVSDVDLSAQSIWSEGESAKRFALTP